MHALLELAACYRAAQLYAHTAHHLAKGPTFDQDHKFFGGLYPAYEEAFDDLCEEALGRKLPYSPAEIMQAVTKRLIPTFKDASREKFFERLMGFEKEFQHEIAEMMQEKGLPDSTQNLIQGLATQSGKRFYMIQAFLS